MTKPGYSKALGLSALLITAAFASCSEEKPNPSSNAGRETDTADVPSDTGPYSELDVTKTQYDGEEVIIEGDTDLPDGSVLSVTFNVPTKPNERYIGVDEEVTVTDGTFVASLAPPQRPEFERGPYVIDVLFTPRGQTPEVVDLVGEDGENLTGPLVRDAFGFNVMDLSERPELSLSIELPSYPFEMPAKFSPESAEYAAAQFALAWRDKDWTAMSQATQLTWRETEGDPTRTLRDWYGFKSLKGFEIERVKQNSSVSVDVTFRVWYEAFTNQIEEHEITGRVLRESAPYELDESGVWGVNPSSTLRGR